VNPYYDKDGITLYHGDCREILPQIEPVDVIITDPPYGDPSDKNQLTDTEYRSRLDSILGANAKTIWILAKVMGCNAPALYKFVSDNVGYLNNVGVWVKPNGEKFEYLYCFSKERGSINEEFFPPGYVFDAGDAVYNSIAFPARLPEIIITRFGGNSFLDPRGS